MRSQVARAPPMSETTANMSKHVSPPGDASPPLPVLSEEIIWEILLRVPVRSLMRFRCVSKSWKTLISHPQFVKDHLHVSTTDSNMAHQRLASSIYREPHKIASFPVQPLIQNPSTPFQVCHFEMGGEYHIIGSCNGLLCMTDPYENYVTLWNPSINLISKSLPLGCLPNVTFLGFGYDNINDKYKLLGITNLTFDDETVTRIYTFGVDSWTVIPNLRRYPAHWLGKFLNGNLNWLAQKDPNDDQWLIITLNLATETYGEMVLFCGDKDKVFFPGLSVISNCLYLHFYDSEKSHSVVWLMKEYGVEDSWTKLMIIPHNDPLLCPVFFELVCISENNVVLLNIVTFEYVLYNSNDGRFNYVGIRANYRPYLQIYHESLVPLPC